MKFIKKNLLLLCVLFAIILGVYFPLEEGTLKHIHITAPLVALMFISQGMNIDAKELNQPKKYSKILLGAFFIAIVMYPAMAFLTGKVFDLHGEYLLGLLLLCCFPNSLESAMAMSASARGNALLSVVLLIVLNIIGLVSIPVNITLWLGSESSISELVVLKNLLFYLFIPVGIGQIIRHRRPDLPEKLSGVTHRIPVICISVLVYVSCSRESAIFNSISAESLMHIVVPSVILHLIMLGAAFVMAKYVLKISGGYRRSFVLITSEKPLSLSVAFWSITFAKDHPLAVFPILIFYVGQVVIDSFVVSQMNKRFYEAEAERIIEENNI